MLNKHRVACFCKTVLTLLTMAISINVLAAPELKGIEFWNASDADSKTVIDHSKWQSILDTYLDDQHVSGINRFDYKSVSKADYQTLKSYLSDLQSIKPRDLKLEQQFAYWVNLYNAKTVDFIINGVQKDQIKSIREIRSLLVLPGPWKRKDLKVEGQKVSLDDIEHGILRPIWKDHRIHYAVNCASLGCPNLLKTAFTSENSEELLDIAEESFISHPRAVSIGDGNVILSSLFDWYGDDFADNRSELLDYVSDFVADEVVDVLSEDTEINFQYDWNLNAP